MQQAVSRERQSGAASHLKVGAQTTVVRVTLGTDLSTVLDEKACAGLIRVLERSSGEQWEERTIRL
jgi:hypothetical protein